ncbi:MAG: outer membrane protein [Silanimonas sp.]
MKLLDYTLIGLLAGMTSLQLAAQDAPSRKPATSAGTPECDDTGCVSDEGVLFEVRTRGTSQPATAATSAADALQPDRRVEVDVAREASEWTHALESGQAVAVGQWSIDLPDGGTLWATEDPAIGQPQFSVSAPSLVAFDGRRIVEPVRFYSFNNYPAFIERAEVLVFRASDIDLVEPLATVPLPVAAVSEAEWDGALPADFQARRGDELVYLVRAFGADGSFDETFPQRLQLVSPQEAQRGQDLLRGAVERREGIALDPDDAERRSQIENVFGQSALARQNIPIYGSRIRIQGRDIAEGYTVSINGRSQPVDLEGTLVAEYLVPVGTHRFDVELGAPSGERLSRTLELDVTGRYMFAVAIADVTLSGNSASGSLQPIGNDDRFDDSLVVDGRLAFYLKGKIKGKYLVTAQADTREREISELFNGFWDADPQDVFRRLDPDRYYPVYGDDSTTYRDVDTQGRLYVRVDWDKSQALWGNFATGITGTEYGQYSRALYGGALSWRSRRATALGEPGSELKLFASEAQTAPGHSEFLGTGGSLYYLKHGDVLPGSERLVLEIRDGTTGRVEASVPLVRGADYEIDEFQGRVTLTRPLASVTRENLPTITRDTPLDGFAQVLLVDYEYVPTGFDADEITAGFRGKHWFGEHVGLGATWIDENRAGDDYALRGVDLTLQAGRGTFLKVEQSQSEATSAPIFFSDNGGLSFVETNAATGRREGEARAVEARANFRELGWTKQDWSAGAWWRDVGAGFSTGRFDTGADVEETGAEVLGRFHEGFSLRARHSVAERGAESLTQSQVAGEWRIGEIATLTGEVRRVDEQRLAGDGAGTLAALEYRHRFGSALELYGIAQITLDDDDGRYAENDAYTVGAKYLFGELSSVGAELTSGDRGDAARIDAEYRLTPEHTFYGAYTYSTDRSPFDPLFNSRGNAGWTLGQRWRLSNQSNLFNESQYLKDPNGSGLAHTFGMDFFPGVGWTAGFTLQQAELDRGVGVVDRRAVSVNAGRTSNDTRWSSRIERREDRGLERRSQWVTTNLVTHRFNDSFRVAARLNYSRTEDELLASAGAEFTEANFGFAWRPFDSTRWALLGRYTFLYDVSALPQVGENIAFYDQRSQVLAFEGIHTPNPRWEFAGKFARREGEVRFDRLQGQWADSAATFLAGQARYAFADKWSALAEYRWLSVEDGGDRSGALLGVDRDLGEHFRVGAGYNFTDFSDDLTDFDYDHRGWFLNVVGWY